MHNHLVELEAKRTDVHVHFDCAGSHKVALPILGPDIFPVNSRPKIALATCSCVSIAQACTKSAPRGSQALGLWHFMVNCRINGLLWKFLKGSLHDPAQVLKEKIINLVDHGEILSRRSFQEDLADAMSYRCLHESSCGGSWQVLVSRPS